MLARNEIMIKWSLYAAAAALCLLAQGAIFQRITLWGDSLSLSSAGGHSRHI